MLRELKETVVGSGHRVLDIGCGDGLFFDKLAAFGTVLGVEKDPMLVAADGPHRSRIILGSFGPGFEVPGPFDVILMLDVLEHMDDPGGALRRAAELLAPAGVLVATVPALRGLWTSHDALNRHRTRFGRPELLRLASAAGLRPERCFFAFHWLAAAKLLVRWAERRRSRGPRLPSLPPGPLNRLLEGLCVLEQRLSRSHPVPFGSSLVAVLRRGPSAERRA